ncbi:hypothetical protein [Lysobacter sp. H23M47]|uniref:hypothetical protein n=1 Tax=Lysobacter sp. H23M47 TaxID=2781024 RepID=UPI00187E3A30|nr:hypothetical protein [Lysobacter sp. H23M47]QOW24496.1 hypothetical protein INQ43_12610 [Lysobacter sp. H23M47]
MNNRFFGLSNIYLKVGFLLVVAALVLLGAVVAIPSFGGLAINQAFGFLLFSGAILYVIGRVVQVRRSRARA